jgi:hypothetical protein
VVGQDADLANGSAGEQERRLTRPYLSVYRDDLNVQFRHATPPFRNRSGQAGR